MSRTKPASKRQSATRDGATDTLPRHGNRSILIGVSLLKVIASFGRPATLTEIASAAGMLPARAHRYLIGLTRSELVEHSAATQRYDLGSQIVELGIAALGRSDAVRLATEALIPLSQQTGFPALIVVWGTNGPTVIRWEQADLPSAVRIREGRNLSVLRSSSGRVFLTFLPASTLEPVLRRELKSWNANHPKEQAISAKSIESIRESVIRHGLGVSVGEEAENIAGISAPVFDANGRLMLSMTLLSSRGSIDTSYDGKPALALKEVTSRISRRLGATAGQFNQS